MQGPVASLHGPPRARGWDSRSLRGLLRSVLCAVSEPRAPDGLASGRALDHDVVLHHGTGWSDLCIAAGSHQLQVGKGHSLGQVAHGVGWHRAGVLCVRSCWQPQGLLLGRMLEGTGFVQSVSWASLSKSVHCFRQPPPPGGGAWAACAPAGSWLPLDQWTGCLHKDLIVSHQAEHSDPCSPSDSPHLQVGSSSLHLMVCAWVVWWFAEVHLRT